MDSWLLRQVCGRRTLRRGALGGRAITLPPPCAAAPAAAAALTPPPFSAAGGRGRAAERVGQRNHGCAGPRLLLPGPCLPAWRVHARARRGLHTVALRCCCARQRAQGMRGCVLRCAVALRQQPGQNVAASYGSLLANSTSSLLLQLQVTRMIGSFLVALARVQADSSAGSLFRHNRLQCAKAAVS